jgi:hypothetical protein
MPLNESVIIRRHQQNHDAILQEWDDSLRALLALWRAQDERNPPGRGKRP